MSADLATRPPVTAGGRPTTVLARLTARQAIRSAAIWGLVFGVFVALTAIAYAASYPTPSARAQVAATFGMNPGITALLGPARQIDTVAGFTAWRGLGVLSILGAVWGVLTGTRLLRGEEAAGRWELLLVGQTTRRTGTAQALVGLLAGLLTLWGITAVLTIAAGRTARVGIDAGPAMFLALALVCAAAISLTVGALASQFAATRRQAAAYAAAALGTFFVLRMIADSGTGLDWLRWLSPLGWVQELRPLTTARPLVLLPIVALIVVLAALTIHLAGSRDLGASVIADRSSAAARTRLLTGPIGLTVRLTRGGALAWASAITVLALLMGLIAKSAGSTLAQDAADREMFAQLGFRGSGAEQYLGVTFLVIALLVALAAAAQITAARDEEAEGRLEHLLVRPVTRYRWLAGRLGVATGYLVITGLGAGLASWLGAASQDAGVGLGALLSAGFNVVPAAVFVLGIGTLTFGIRPRAVTLVTYGLVTWSFLIEITGGIVQLSPWLLNTSLFHQMAAAPAASPDWDTCAIMTAIGALAAGLGALAFRYRDLTGE